MNVKLNDLNPKENEEELRTRRVGSSIRAMCSKL